MRYDKRFTYEDMILRKMMIKQHKEFIRTGTVKW